MYAITWNGKTRLKNINYRHPRLLTVGGPSIGPLSSIQISLKFCSHFPPYASTIGGKSRSQPIVGSCFSAPILYSLIVHTTSLGAILPVHFDGIGDQPPGAQDVVRVGRPVTGDHLAEDDVDERVVQRNVD
ncbi:hypothetical protein [Luteimonas salinilitoris]|uniref:Uncharacterized protein n=1 Tax=Luteimonas salinilitoris TaxID=3237697 RepID=A0ABV4HPG8_9GAMM